MQNVVRGTLRHVGVHSDVGFDGQMVLGGESL